MNEHSSPVEFKFSAGNVGEIAGYASTFGGIDLGGDSIAPGAYASTLAELKASGNRLPMLWAHDSAEPIGSWLSLEEDRKGLFVTGRINLDTVKGAEAYALVKAGDLNGLSIGYRVRPGGAVHSNGVRTLKAVDLFEVSLVAVPMDQRARLTAVKGIESLAGFEGFLRSAGFPRRMAAKLAHGGWPALSSSPEEPDPTDVAALVAAIKAASSLVKG